MLSKVVIFLEGDNLGNSLREFFFAKIISDSSVSLVFFEKLLLFCRNFFVFNNIPIKFLVDCFLIKEDSVIKKIFLFC